ncbi:hypothetical protein DPMN_096004 [Dreissena polymorpha]|uniref:Uncharacterized protein n=1 Tax=Dreissena polymorpha TaxID=45954 RepID=A0A9D4L8Y8_DREPO|nr:hypothetical protein DPMN_096004 [Dreissena polymorpha]
MGSIPLDSQLSRATNTIRKTTSTNGHMASKPSQNLDRNGKFNISICAKTTLHCASQNTSDRLLRRSELEPCHYV